MDASDEAKRIVVDTNVLVSAALSPHSATREVLRRCFLGRYQPLVSHKLFLEYEDVLGRDFVEERSPFGRDQRERLLDNFLHVCRLIPIYYLWRPNLPDEGDNHVLELAVAGGARIVVTSNTRDLARGELAFDIDILSPRQLLEGDP